QAPGPAEVPAPEELQRLADRLARYPERLSTWARIPRPIDVRYVGEPGWARPGDRPADVHQRVWMRIDGKLPDDALLHACALTYASGLTLLDSVLSVHGEVWATAPVRGAAADAEPEWSNPGGIVGGSLDHALWFHRPFRADE